MKQTSEKRQSGFTMIEIMVVVVIVAILAAIAVPTYVRYVESARASEAKSVIGNIDKIFGFFFGFIRGYVIAVCIFATSDIIYNHNKWPLNLKKSYFFTLVEQGSNYLIKEFPDKKEYEDAKEKVQEL